MSKKLPKTLEEELRKHDLATNLIARYDYKHKKRTANNLVKELKKIRAKQENG